MSWAVAHFERCSSRKSDMRTLWSTWSANRQDYAHIHFICSTVAARYVSRTRRFRRLHLGLLCFLCLQPFHFPFETVYVCGSSTLALDMGNEEVLGSFSLGHFVESAMLQLSACCMLLHAGRRHGACLSSPRLLQAHAAARLPCCFPL